MAQNDFGTLDPTTESGTSLAGHLNDFRDAVESSHKGNAEPSYKQTGMFWMDDSVSTLWVLKQYTGSVWIPVMTFDISNTVVRMTTQGDANSPQGLPTVKQLQNGTLIWTTTTGSANAYIFDLGVGNRPTAYAAGQEFNAQLNFSNTGACTVNVTGSGGTGLGAKSVKLPDGTDPLSGDLASGYQATLFYDGTNFVFKNPPPVSGAGKLVARKFNRNTSYLSAGGGNHAIAPTIATGSEILTLTHTAGSASNIIRLSFSGEVYGGNPNYAVAAILFDGTTPVAATTGNSNYGTNLTITYEQAAGDTAAHTYSVRICGFSQTASINRNAGWTGWPLGVSLVLEEITP